MLLEIWTSFQADVSVRWTLGNRLDEPSPTSPAVGSTFFLSTWFSLMNFQIITQVKGKNEKSLQQQQQKKLKNKQQKNGGDVCSSG